jgi:predicted GNAT family N-acyltransferase
MLQVLMDRGRLYGTTEFLVSAQIGAVGFYQKMGFEPTGEEFEEAGILHVNMKSKTS